MGFGLTEQRINGSNLANHNTESHGRPTTRVGELGEDSLGRLVGGAGPENDYDNQEPKNVEDHQAVLNLGPNLSTPDIDDVEDSNHGKYQERALVWLRLVAIVVQRYESLNNCSSKKRTRGIPGLP